MKTSSLLYAAGFASILLSAVNFARGKTTSDSGNERNGIFVGHWAPTFFILGKVMEDREARGDEQPLHL
ncbi:hypothetical protein [Deinococcus maricopensis]|uniref:Uncharacterized protein n=1 Tax=Deinococcus maricopensis (strain DSM 21211 / LMG 22137 / NRRL B-23946 / LB-34) TaxID=709986 RepID=E8UBN9_DEIML|nr:hypothetical protein [Deinococcus maricopensis]ADV68478.1 hypothetical protein Deima_2849 [Deinococcus maricopensis DSM 21211]